MTQLATPVVIPVGCVLDGKERLDRIRENTRRKLPRFESLPIREEEIAIVGYGPSLKLNWQKLAGFKYIMTTSGAHDFLIQRGLIPTWHVEVDPREHKTAFLSNPHSDVEYLIATTCHSSLFHALRQSRITIWHPLGGDLEDESQIIKDAWGGGGVLCIGGTTAGTRMLPLAHSLGFRKFALFGLDCSYRKGATWAGPHSGKPHGVIEVICPPPDGRKFFTSPNMLAASDDLFLFIDLTLKARECEFTFVGDTLLSERIKVVFSQGTG